MICIVSIVRMSGYTGKSIIVFYVSQIGGGYLVFHDRPEVDTKR